MYSASAPHGATRNEFRPIAGTLYVVPYMYADINQGYGENDGETDGVGVVDGVVVGDTDAEGVCVAVAVGVIP